MFGASKGGCWWFSGIPCVLRTRPLRSAKGRFGGVLCFFWVPASAGMTVVAAGMTDGPRE